MEVARPAVPEGLKPLKRFTPPPPDLKESETESESDDDDVSGEDDSDEEESSSSETNGDVVKSSLKVEDEFLKNVRLYFLFVFYFTINQLKIQCHCCFFH